MNRVVLVGRLTRDPELRYTPANVAVCTFTIAVSRPFGNRNQDGMSNNANQPTADFIPVVVWRNQAENVKKFTTKGSLVGVDGRIQTRQYDDNQGQRRYVTEVVADNVTFLETKGSQEALNNNASQNQFYQEPQRKDQNSDEDKYSNVVFTNNDLPF